MGRPKGSKNAPNHTAGGRRLGSGRKRKHSEVDGASGDDAPDQPAERRSGPPSSSNEALVSAVAGPTAENDAPATPAIRLQDIHPDLIPFLAVPHHIPLCVFFDPNRYHHPQPESQASENAASAGPSNSQIATTVNTVDEDYDEASQSPEPPNGEHPPSNPTSPSQVGGNPSSSTGPYVFSRPSVDNTSRKRRRCIICMNAGRINHAFICPGRGNRSACATAREISRVGGALPAESSRWNSKNTQTPIFAPVPTPVFSFPLPPGISLQLAGPPSSGAPLQPQRMDPIQILPPPKPDAPLGFLSNGAVRVRKPRRCMVCVGKGEEGTTCPGRSAKQRCPHYVEAVAAAGPSVISMDPDSDDDAYDTAETEALLTDPPSLPDGVAPMLL